jgi:hypothetical protein
VKIKKLVVEFVTMFMVALMTAAMVTFLWSLIGHGESTMDWETSYTLATLSGTMLTGQRYGKSKKIVIPFG